MPSRWITSWIALALAGCVSATGPPTSPVPGTGRTPVASPGTAPSPTAYRPVARPYKDGAGWPLRNFNGLDLFEPWVPLTSIDHGDGGRLVLGTVVPLALATASLAQGADLHSRIELREASWLAADASQDNYPLLWASFAAAAGSALLPDPSVDDGGYSWPLRLDRATVLALGIGLTSVEVELLRPVFRRRRPNGNGYGSRPSGHAATAFAAATFASNALRDWLHPEDEPLGLCIAEEVFCALPYIGASYIALERVHGDKHYLTDVLLGGAIGILTMQMVWNWSFLRIEHDDGGWLDHVELIAGPTAGGAHVELAIRF